MKAIIPLAGKGTRLRPHTLTTPKPLVKVGGRPVMSYIMDDLIALGIEEFVFIVGYLREVIEEYIAREYPGIVAHYVLQEVQDGTAGAIRLAEPFADDEVLIVFVDTLFDADLSLAKTLPSDWAGVIWAKEVEDYQRFGVIVTGEDGSMRKIIEKPTEPVSKLANIGLYYIRDWKLLFEGIHHVIDAPPGPGGEWFLTDAFQYMVDKGAKIRTAAVGGWYDCGKMETLLGTNHHLLATTRGGISPDASLEDTDIMEPVRIEAGAKLRTVALGPNVTVEADAVVEDSTLSHCIVGEGAVVRGSRLENSMIGPGSLVARMRGQVNVGAFSEVRGEG
ncbi:MAG: sugar phosphate nucleotidyltransferase [Gemmatimonadota bacterium]